MTVQQVQGLLAPSDVAEIAGVSRGAVSNWRRRHEDFPPAVGGSPAKPLFDREAVVAWLHRNGRDVRETSAGYMLWSALNGVRGDLPMEQAAKLLLFLATAKRASRLPGFPKSYDELLTAERDHVELLRDWSMQVEQAVIPLRGRIGVRPLWRTQGDAVGRLARAIQVVPDDDLATAVDQCLGDSSRWLGKSGGEYGFVGSRTAALLSALVPPNARTIYDPACGIAAALLEIAARERDRRLVGHDIDFDALSEAAQRAFLHDIDIELAQGNVLASDPDRDLRADVVIVEPPLGVRWDAAAALADARFIYGVPSRSAADLAWIQHAISHLAPDGRAFVLTSNGALSRDGRDADVRSRLLAAGCIEAVVQLPGKLLPNTSIALALWVLRPACTASDVLFVDASDATDLEQHVPRALRAKGESEAGANVPWRRVPITDLVGDGSRLVPAHWVGSGYVSPIDLKNQLRGAVARLGEAISSVAASVPVTPNLDSMAQSRVATVGHLMDDGVVDLIRGRKETHFSDDEWTQRRVLRASDLRDGRLPLQDVIPDEAFAAVGSAIDVRAGMRRPAEFDADLPVTQAGDVLVTTTNEIRTLLDGVGGHLPSSGVDVLRVINESVLRAEYLAAALTGSWNERFQVGSTIQRVPIRDLEVPMLPPDEQESVAASFHELSRVRRAAMTAANEALALQSTILDAVRYNVPLSDLESDTETTMPKSQESK